MFLSKPLRFLNTCFALACTAALCSTAIAQPHVVFEYTAEAGVTAQAAGFVTFGPVSGSLAPSNGIPGLGSAVWEMVCTGPQGSYLKDLTGLLGPDEPFRFSATFRHQETLPQHGTDSCAVTRNRPGGAPGLPQNLPATVNGQWYRVEAIWRSNAQNFVGARWRIDHVTGAETFDGSWSALFLASGAPGSPGSSSLPNSIAMVCANNGSTRVQGQFDNLRLERIGTCIGDYNLSGTASVQDIFDFLAAYFAGDLRSDLNSSSTSTVQDIFDFLAAWFAGC